jgi:acetolactate synthase-1/2/3 large subunit
MVTAGPGMTNAITGIANAHVSRASILVLSGGTPRPRENRGGLQDMDHTQLVRSITRYARTVREPSLVLQELDEAIARAVGEGGEPGPSFIDFPTDTLRGIVPKPLQLEEHLCAKPRTLMSRSGPRREGRRSPLVGASRAGYFRPRRARCRT